MAGPDMQTRSNLAKQGKAIPDPKGSGGSFPIRNEEEARKAIQPSQSAPLHHEKTPGT